MKKLKSALAVVLFSGFVSAAQAQVLILLAAASLTGHSGVKAEPLAQSADQRMYAQAGLLHLGFAKDGSHDAPDLARFIVGYDIRHNISVEGLAALNLRKADNVSGQSFGLYVKPRMALGEHSELFARLGVANTRREYQGASNASTQLSYGLGASTNITKHVYAQVDYMNYGRVDGYKSSGLALSVGKRF